MEAACPKCAAPADGLWVYCPHCGNTIKPESLPTADAAGSQPAPVEGAFGGLLVGLLTVPVLIILGTLLCLTGLGAILGVPMIVGAIFAPLLGPMIGLGALKGNCPWCAGRLGVLSSKQSFDCSHCKQRVLIRKGKFVRAETAESVAP